MLSLWLAAYSVAYALQNTFKASLVLGGASYKPIHPIPNSPIGFETLPLSQLTDQMMGSDEYIQASEEKIFESFTCSETPQNPKKKNNKVENKRRFSDEQIRSLECIFESESKLEPRKKMQLARDIGLQPRQVAIWFQNKRARWKSKRIEQDYRKLRDEYDSLASRFESLKKEKESLQFELQKLNGLLETSHDGKENSRHYGGLCSGHSNWRTEAKPRFSNDDQNEISKKTGYSEDIGYQLLKMDEHEEVPLGSLEKWYSGDPSALLDQPCTSSHSQWLDFWS